MSATSGELLAALLAGPLPAGPLPAGPLPASPAEWADRHAALPGTSADRALRGGLGADRPAWAFASGYHAALERLLPTGGLRCALCITEAGGNHPRAIQARVQGGRLVGEKRFVFLGPLAQRLFVLARSGEDAGGRPALRIYPVDADAPGVQIVAGGPAPLVPEVPHGRLFLDTPAPPPLSGDGWDRYARPFRTVEDIHVSLGLLGFGLRLARGQPPEVAESLLPPVLALRALALLDPSSPATHRALAPALGLAWERLEALPWERLGPAAAWWSRDRAILQVGAAARDRRLALAREALSPAASP